MIWFGHIVFLSKSISRCHGKRSCPTIHTGWAARAGGMWVTEWRCRCSPHGLSGLVGVVGVHDVSARWQLITWRWCCGAYGQDGVGWGVAGWGGRAVKQSIKFGNIWSEKVRVLSIFQPCQLLIQETWGQGIFDCLTSLHFIRHETTGGVAWRSSTFWIAAVCDWATEGETVKPDPFGYVHSMPHSLLPEGMDGASFCLYKYLDCWDVGQLERSTCHPAHTYMITGCNFCSAWMD